MDHDIQARVLRRAVAIAGSENRLCHMLGVQPHALVMWLSGKALPPDRVLSFAVDLVLDDDLARAAQDRRKEVREHSALSPAPVVTSE
jgi:DNA-binding transcriptional regulator YdaS (Cro superfamily)